MGLYSAEFINSESFASVYKEEEKKLLRNKPNLPPYNAQLPTVNFKIYAKSKFTNIYNYFFKTYFQKRK